MKRSISVMVGKGSQRHNSRKFVAENVDANRTKNNIEYCDMPLRDVYHELFDKAIVEYNAKQKRRDRMIDDYYDKIRAGKQEKLFHEIIFQVGNMKDMNTKTDDGQLAAKVLDDFMQSFQKRNLYMKVFSAHLHMDEETPHLHIDFVPFTTGSKRGLETRISLKQALAAQGFTGGTRKETEWNQWVQSEKEQLAAIMKPYGIEWKDMGNTEKHLNQLNFEKRERIKEVSEMEQKITVIAEEKISMENEIGAIDDRLQHLQDKENLIGLNVDKYDKDTEWQLPDPGALISAKSYKTKIIDPYIKRLKDVVRSIVAQYLKMKDTVNDLRKELSYMKNRVWGLNDTVDNMRSENEKLRDVVTDYKLVRKVLGNEKTDSILEQAKTDEHAAKQRSSRKNNFER